MSDAILALNAGSSSVKFGVYDVEPTTGEPSAAARGTLNVGASSRLIASAVDGTLLVERSFPEDGLAAAIRVLLDWIEREFGGRRVAACGHRIVHGATSFSDPVRLTPALVDAIDGLTPLAPLHQPRSVAPIRALLELRPDLPQIGCFDTAFHRTMGPPASRFALPRDYEARGIRRFGFHGLSYEYVAGRLREEGKAGMKTVVAHLGNGASLCAMKDGRSLDTTMGFSALDGLVMGTRCGAIDPGVLLYLMRHGGMTPNDLEDLLYRQSGLLGVSGLSGDMRDLEASADPRAREAIDLFAFRVSRETAALANTLEGLDCLVFTAGIGEHSAVVRKAVCERLRWLGVAIDQAANEAHAGQIGLPASSIEVRIIPTDEESVIASHACDLVRPGRMS